MLMSLERVCERVLLLLVAAGVILLPIAAQSQTQAQTPPASLAQTPAQAASTDADESEPPEPTLSKKPLSAEAIVIYRIVLKEYRGDEQSVLHLSNRTILITHTGVTAEDGCMKPEEIEAQPNVIHLLSNADVKKLGDAKLELVDAQVLQHDMEMHDPRNGIQAGQSIDSAVSNGFAHAQFTLSEIQFDKKHEHAIVSYSFICGRLCGHGGTMQFTKVKGVWTKTGRCHGWIS
jgi:hypothetical protein